MKHFTALAVISLAACTLRVPDDGNEFLAVATAALPQIERGQTNVKYLVEPSVDPRARLALAKLRTVVDRSEVPEVAGISLPRGYIVIQRFTLSADEALVQGQGGPVIAGNRMSCRYYATVPLKRIAGQWVAEQVPVAVC